MNPQTRRAAQYIRMSTDRQDLSPLIQKEAIAAFATANAIEVIRSYEDEGRSGIQLANRPGLRGLLRDVAAGVPFKEVLVYDISRWGRFQDADAAAYYEYHCRLHGVEVIYVSESFPNDQTPASVLLKCMRRVMAAEYSRDIASKSRAGQQRVIGMGFQMGPLPPLGYRRCSVSADGSRRLLLEHGQRKAALTDRVEWVLGPQAEVTLVRRICLSAAAGVELDQIASLVRAEGWHTAKGRTVTTRSINLLLRNEALIGNFVWGAKSKGGKVLKCTPSRMNGSVPRIIDDATWAAIQVCLRSREPTSRCLESKNGCVASKPHLRNPRQLRLRFNSSSTTEHYRRTLGEPSQLRSQTRKFGTALSSALGEAGLTAGFDSRTNVLTFWETRVRVRLMWPCSATRGNSSAPGGALVLTTSLSSAWPACTAPGISFWRPPHACKQSFVGRFEKQRHAACSATGAAARSNSYRA